MMSGFIVLFIRFAIPLDYGKESAMKAATKKLNPNEGMTPAELEQLEEKLTNKIKARIKEKEGEIKTLNVKKEDEKGKKDNFTKIIEEVRSYMNAIKGCRNRQERVAVYSVLNLTCYSFFIIEGFKVNECMKMANLLSNDKKKDNSDEFIKEVEDKVELMKNIPLH